MKIAITDACIFIDLFELDLINHFFSLAIEVHTSVDIINELDAGQQQALKNFETASKFTQHKLSGDELLAINAAGYPGALSNSDKTALFLAEKLNATLLSSDKLLRTTAKNKGIDYHGMLWIIDQLLEQALISKAIAVEKLTILSGYNFYRNNAGLMEEISKRVEQCKE